MDSRSLPNIEQLKEMFDRINQTCQLTGESVVDYSNVEYYTEQIANIYDCGYNKAKQAALRLSFIS